MAPDHITNYVITNPKVLVMTEAPNEAIGVPKTNATTEHMFSMFNRALTFDNIHFAQKIIVYKGHDIPGAKGEFINQIRNMEWEQISDKSYKLSGKKKGNDDIMVTAMMCIYWVNAFCYFSIVT